MKWYKKVCQFLAAPTEINAWKEWIVMFRFKTLNPSSLGEINVSQESFMFGQIQEAREFICMTGTVSQALLCLEFTVNV